MELISQIDMETREPIKSKGVRFVKNGAGVVCRIQVWFLLFAFFPINFLILSH